MWAVPEGVIFRLTTGVLFRSTTFPPWSGFRLALRRTPHSTGGGTAEKSRAAFLAKASPLETSRMAVIVAAAHVIVDKLSTGRDRDAGKISTGPGEAWYNAFGDGFGVE